MSERPAIIDGQCEAIIGKTHYDKSRRGQRCSVQATFIRRDGKKVCGCHHGRPRRAAAGDYSGSVDEALRGVREERAER